LVADVTLLGEKPQENLLGNASCDSLFATHGLVGA
jgi:hypothetical protein